MSATSTMILIGIGTSGCAMARGVRRAFGGETRYLLIDSDAHTATENDPFLLLGGDRLAGRGTGGDVTTGRLAAEDSLHKIDEYITGVRLAVVVTSLGGGTGGGATYELLRYFDKMGLPTIVFATTPFAFEGEDRQRNSRGIMGMIEEVASTAFFLPLDKIIGDTDNMELALHRATDTLASGITLFWRLIEKPGYIRLDAEQLRHVVAGCGRGRFAIATAQGPARVQEVLDHLMRSEMLALSSAPIRATLCGVLAGNDLLLSEVGKIAEGVRSSFGGLSFTLATVNDEETFSGRLAVVVMLFEATPDASSGSTPSTEPPTHTATTSRRRKTKSALTIGPNGRGRFKNSDPTIWNGEDLDVPTYLRKNISIDL